MQSTRTSRFSYLAIYCALIAFAIPWQRVSWIHKGITPFHFVNAVLLTLALLPFLNRKPVKFHFLAPLFVYLLGTVLGMFSSKFVLYNIYTIGQDLYLYIWFVLMCVVLAVERNEKYLVVAWMVAAMIVVFVTADGSIFETVDVSRLEFSFRNPNRAAAYFVLGIFLSFHPVVPWVLRFVIVGLLVKALLATGSAGGLLAFLAGAGVLVVIWFYLRYGDRLRLQAVMLIGLCGILLVGALLMTGEGLRQGYSDATGQAGARVDRSADVRQMIWANGLATFREHPLGIGPGSFFQQFPTEFGRDSKNVELHSDWFSTLVERGVVGIAGLVGLIVAIGIKTLKLIGLGILENNDKRYSLWIAALAGATVSYIALSFTHEVLHHETFWLVLALIMASIRRLNMPGNDEYDGVVKRRMSYVPVSTPINQETLAEPRHAREPEIR